jgi:hypothetical protein
MLIRRRRLEIRLPLFAADSDWRNAARSRFVRSWLNNRPRARHRHNNVYDRRRWWPRRDPMPLHCLSPSDGWSARTRTVKYRFAVYYDVTFRAPDKGRDKTSSITRVSAQFVLRWDAGTAPETFYGMGAVARASHRTINIRSCYFIFRDLRTLYGWSGRDELRKIIIEHPLHVTQTYY